MVRDEGPMLRKWVDHYGAQLGLDNLLVIDDSSADGSTDALPCRVLRIPPITGHFERQRMRIVSEAAGRLRRFRTAVVFADADEFIVADPARYDGLRDLVAARKDRDAVGVMAFNVIHSLAEEAPLDLTRPVLEQRRRAIFVPIMCKPSVKLTRNPWAAASHGVKDATYQVDPDLYMFHLKFADRDHLAEVAAKRRAMVDHDQRAAGSSWKFSGDEMVDVLVRLNDAVRPLGETAVYAPDPAVLAGIPIRMDNGVMRASGQRQVPVMEAADICAIPERFASLV
jgi:hypothetical protein